MHSEAIGDLLALIDIDPSEEYLSFELFRDGLEDRLCLPAGAAPIRVEIEDHGDLGTQDPFLEIILSNGTDQLFPGHQEQRSETPFELFS